MRRVYIVAWLLFAVALTLSRASTWAAGIEVPELSGADMSPDVAANFGLGQEPNLSQDALGSADVVNALDLNRFGMSAPVNNISQATSGGVMGPGTLGPARILGTGRPTSGNEGFNSPLGIAVDGEGNVYVADTENHRIQIFDAQGNYFRTLGTGQETFGNEGFRHPSGVAVDGKGNVYVADNFNHRVQIFDRQGNYLKTLGIGRTTDGNKGFRFPWGVAVDGQGNIYVADFNNCRIQVFDANGNYLGKLGAGQATYGNKGFKYFSNWFAWPLNVVAGRIIRSGQKWFHDPEGVTVDGRGNVYVADTFNHRVQIFDARGRFLKTLGTGRKTSGNEGFDRPFAIAVDAKGNVYVTDPHNSRVQVFDSQWHYLTTLKLNKGRDDRPTGIALDGQGNLYVADVANHRIVVFPSIAPSESRLKSLKQELDKTVKQADWDGDGSAAGGRFKIWDSLSVRGKP